VKRLLWFLVLLAAGILALRLAVGDDPLVAHQDATDATPPQARSGVGIPLGQGQIGASWQTSGPFHYTWSRTILTPDGSRRNEPIYQIDAEDSRPVLDGLQQLDRMTITLFRQGHTIGVVNADQAFVAIGRDANGRLSLQEDKEVDLRGLRLEGNADSAFGGLRLSIARARLLFGSAAISLQTQDLAEPVQVDFAGDRPASLRGKGLRASLPRERSAPDAVASLEILSDPVLEAGGMVANARGSLLYREAMVGGAITVTLENDVQLTLPLEKEIALPGTTNRLKPQTNRNTKELLTVQAARLTLHGRRPSETERIGGQDSLDLNLIRMAGSPTTVVIQGLHAQAPSFDLVLDQQKEPTRIIGWGGKSTINAVTPEGSGYSATTPERLEIRRPGAEAVDLMRGCGFPQWTLRQLTNQNTMHLHGQAEIAADQRIIKATQGIRILHGDPQGMAATVDGWGSIQLTIPPQDNMSTAMQADSDDGFRLSTYLDREEIRLGPATPEDFLDEGHQCWGHKYSIRSGTASLGGSGGCSLIRRGASSEFTLISRNSDITARGSGLRAEFQQVRSLWAKIEGEALHELQVTGTPVKATFNSEAEQIVAYMPALYRTGPASYRAIAVEHLEQTLQLERPGLLDGCPTNHRLPSITLTGTNLNSDNLLATAPRIDMHLGPSQSIIVDALAIGDELVVSSGSTTLKPSSPSTSLSMQAQRVRLLPHLVPGNLLDSHNAASLPAPLVGNMLPSRGWVIAEQVRQFEIVDPNHGTLAGSGHRLIFSPNDGSLLMLGNAEIGQPTQISRLHEGRRMTATGAYVRAWRDPDLRVRAGRNFPGATTTCTPYVVLRQAEAANPLSHLGIHCEGDVDLLPTEVVFHGPVNAWSLQENGEHDPLGLALQAQRLHVQRHPTTHEILRATATDVDMSWQQLKARSREVELDLRWHLLTARDPVCATVTMRDGQTFSAEYVSINYETMAVEATYGELRRQPIRRDL